MELVWSHILTIEERYREHNQCLEVVCVACLVVASEYDFFAVERRTYLELRSSPMLSRMGIALQTTAHRDSFLHHFVNCSKNQGSRSE